MKVKFDNLYDDQSNEMDYQAFRPSFVLNGDPATLKIVDETLRGKSLDADLSHEECVRIGLEKEYIYSPKEFLEGSTEFLKDLLDYPEEAAALALSVFPEARHCIYAETLLKYLSHHFVKTNYFLEIPPMISGIFGLQAHEYPIATILKYALSLNETRDEMIDLIETAYPWMTGVMFSCIQNERPLSLRDFRYEKKFTENVESIYVIYCYAGLKGVEVLPDLKIAIVNISWQMIHVNSTYYPTIMARQQDLKFWPVNKVCTWLKISEQELKRRILDVRNSIGTSAGCGQFYSTVSYTAAGRRGYYPEWLVTTGLTEETLVQCTKQILCSVYFNNYLSDEMPDDDPNPVMYFKRAARSAVNDAFNNHLYEIVIAAAQAFLSCQDYEIYQRLAFDMYASLAYNIFLPGNDAIYSETTTEQEDILENLRSTVEMQSHEIDTLKYDIGRREARIRNLEEKLSNLKQEIPDEEPDTDDPVESEIFVEEYELTQKLTLDEALDVIKKSTCAVIGGHINWQQKLKEKCPNWEFFLADALGIPDTLSSYDKVFFYTNYLSHKTFYKALKALKKERAKIAFVSSTNIDHALVEMAEKLG